MTALSTTPPAVQPLERSPGYWRSVLTRLLRDKVALGASSVILILIFMAVFGPYIAPVDPYQSSILGRLKAIGSPGFPLGSDELGRDMLSRLIVGARLSLLLSGRNFNKISSDLLHQDENFQQELLNFVCKQTMHFAAQILS